MNMSHYKKLNNRYKMDVKYPEKYPEAAQFMECLREMTLEGREFWSEKVYYLADTITNCGILSAMELIVKVMKHTDWAKGDS